MQFALKSTRIWKSYSKNQRGPDFMEHGVLVHYTSLHASTSLALWVRDMDRQQDPGKALPCLRHLVSAENFTDSVHQAHTTNDTVGSITGCFPVSEKVKSFRLRFFGHLARSAPDEDHHRVIAAALRPPADWRRPSGRPRSTWLRVIDEDVQPQNFGSTRGLEEGKGKGYLASSRQYGNALLGVRH